MRHMIRFDDYLNDYDLSLSVGGQIQINCNLDDFVGKHFELGSDMMICRHPDRDCIYDEAEACKLVGKDDPQRIDRHMQRYRAAGYPAHNGLYATAIIGRRHDRESLKEMCRFWFDELKQGSRRDQLSLNYALWKSGPIRISELDFAQTFYADRKFILHPHFGQRAELNPFHDHARFDNGLFIAPVVMRLYMSIVESSARWPNPQTTGPGSFFDWLNAAAESDPHRGALPAISNLAAYVHQARIDLQKAFPDPFGQDRARYAEWYWSSGRREHELSWLRPRE
jgi:hypothetical protein